MIQVEYILNLIAKVRDKGFENLAQLLEDLYNGKIKGLAGSTLRAVTGECDVVEIITTAVHVYIHPSLTICLQAYVGDEPIENVQDWWLALDTCKSSAKRYKQERRYLLYSGSDHTDKIDHTGLKIPVGLYSDAHFTHHQELPQYLVVDTADDTEYDWQPVDLGLGVPRYWEIDDVLRHLDEEISNFRHPQSTLELLTAQVGLADAAMTMSPFVLSEDFVPGCDDEGEVPDR
jgi:hypothetical protein